MTITTAALSSIPARFERATPGFGGRGVYVAAVSGTERLFPLRPIFAGFCEVAGAALSAEHRRLSPFLAQSRHKD